MVPMGEFRFAMIAGKLIIAKPPLQFQNGRRVNKMVACCFEAWIPRFRGTENGGAMEDLHLKVSFKLIGMH